MTRPQWLSGRSRRRGRAQDSKPELHRRSGSRVGLSLPSAQGEPNVLALGEWMSSASGAATRPLQPPKAARGLVVGTDHGLRGGVPDSEPIHHEDQPWKTEAPPAVCVGCLAAQAIFVIVVWTTAQNYRLQATCCYEGFNITITRTSTSRRKLQRQTRFKTGDCRDY
ncbi:hypothetical protein AVEN_223084-1 [Araneus ventricosus]|uniref:Uncharacterized protein n=1 Tax=Araneus ventricosus TaxID=182803 RepID=A0A4Y2UJ23_ARAVE|nr:hypothetical protein AVEN_223084-1 [Araneus ventricosus]